MSARRYNSDRQEYTQMVTYSLDDLTIEAFTSSDLFSPKALDSGSKLLLEFISKQSQQYISILDWGCGWGAMSLWIAKKYPQAQVVGLDSDIGAVMIAEQNIGHNKLKNVEIVASHGYSAISISQMFDLIVSNPPTHRGREVVEEMITKTYAHLVAQGSIVIVVEARLKPWVHKKVQEVFGNATIASRSNKHVVISATKMIQ